MKKLYFDVKKCVACRTCELSCSVSHSAARELFKALNEKDISLPRIKVSGAKSNNFPVSCRHCDDPKCVDACMSAALVKDAETGKVIYDKDKCVGCWMCVMVCPYGAIRPDKNIKVPLRCDYCTDIGEPQCVKNCPTKAITSKEEKDVEKAKT